MNVSLRELLPPTRPAGDEDPSETAEWIESLQSVKDSNGVGRAQFLLQRLIEWGHRSGVAMPFSANTPYVNTISAEVQPPFPGDRAIERRIKSIIRWNAMAMVVRGNRVHSGIGGHISTYASCATLFEIGFNHFFRGSSVDGGTGDQVYFQGHASPGVYARAFLEGRLSMQQLNNFRFELAPGGGLSSYPHPWLMPKFWEFPTVSMGLGAISAIYQARFNRYLKDRGLADTSDSKVWCFLGDGETDEPESLGAITLASREGLDNLIFVINCNLQRLDGPVRGNGKIIQELEAAFRGAGWNVIKVIWGSDWDPLLAADDEGLLVQRMNDVVDGQYQKYTVESGAYTRQDFFGTHPRLLSMVEHLSDDQIRRLSRGGHDPVKVYSAYHAAVNHRGAPTVILAKTIKGYGMGEAGEGRNITHQQKKLNEDELREFRDRFEIPIADEHLAEAPFYRPPEDSEEIEYLMERRRALGGFLPRRRVRSLPIQAPKLEVLGEFLEGTGEREAATTMAFVRLLARLLRDKDIGPLIVPIIPDEARTFGMDALFRQYGIYAHHGQLYEPVDSHLLLYYREAKDGQILEEGITEAGAMSSFTAAGTAYSTHGVNTIPFFIFYSMFGFQRIGDLIWQCADQRGKGFLLGATAGRTTLNGEGLQHQDGHSQLLACSVPNLIAYDPAYAYEVAVIIQDGIHRMHQLREDVFYYLTLYNETYVNPPMPPGAREGILKGMYLFQEGSGPAPQAEAQSEPAPEGAGQHTGPKTRVEDPPRLPVNLLGSGPILRLVREAADILRERFDVAAHVWSVTSYKELRRDALAVQRWNMLHPTEPPRKPYVTELLEQHPAPVVAASDYLKLVADQIAPWVPGGMLSLGTDGFGRSDTRERLRNFFEVDANFITVAALYELARHGRIPFEQVRKAINEFDIDPERADPLTV